MWKASACMPRSSPPRLPPGKKRRTTALTGVGHDLARPVVCPWHTGAQSRSGQGMRAKQKVMKTLLTKTGRHGRIRALTREYLDQITTEDLKRLTEFADRRLGSLPRSRFTADDAVQKALLSILRGTVDRDAGRRPRMEQVKTKSAFLHYVRSVINSVIEGRGRCRELLYLHGSIHENQDSEDRHTAIVLASAAQPDADAVMVDLKTELFKRLYKSASRKLVPVIEEWEETFFWASHVPCRRKRDYVRQVRMLAIRVLKELAEDLRR